jgi:hypothetical protein
MKYSEPFVKVINPLQFKLYMKHGVKPIDMYYNPSNDRVIFIYTVAETQDLFKLWCDRKLK